MFNKILQIIDLQLRLWKIGSIYPVKNWIKNNVVKPVKAGFKNWIYNPIRDNLVKPIIRDLKISYNSLKEDLRSAYNYLESIENPVGKFVWNFAKKAPLAPFRLIGRIANGAAYGVSTSFDVVIRQPAKKYIIQPANKVLDRKIDNLKGKFTNLVEDLVPKLKENLAEQLRVAWKAANPDKPDLDSVFQSDLGQALDQAINFSTNAAEEVNKSENQPDGLEVSVTLHSNVRSAMKPTSKVKFKLHIELTDEFAKVFSNDKMDEARKVNAEDVLKKAADSFFTERGYNSKNLDISIKTQAPKKDETRRGPQEPITSFDHIFRDRAEKEAAKKRAAEGTGNAQLNGKANGATPPAVTPATATSKADSGEQPFPS